MGEAFWYVDVYGTVTPIEGEVDSLLDDVAGRRGICNKYDRLVVAANITCESGVRLTPEVSLSAPLPFHASEAKPLIARTG